MPKVDDVLGNAVPPDATRSEAWMIVWMYRIDRLLSPVWAIFVGIGSWAGLWSTHAPGSVVLSTQQIRAMTT